MFELSNNPRHWVRRARFLPARGAPAPRRPALEPRGPGDGVRESPAQRLRFGALRRAGWARARPRLTAHAYSIFTPEYSIFTQRRAQACT